MNIGIFGRHPVPQPGFNGVMSLYEAKWFSLFGHQVELLIPFQSSDDLSAFCRRHDLASLDDLERFGGEFSIRAVFPDGKDFGDFDAIIYQSYDPADWENFYKICRRSTKILTKNFPKFVSGDRYYNDHSVVNQFKAFDLIACALKDDMNELKTCEDFYEKHKHQVAYVGRGADEDLLHPGRKNGIVPVIGLDVPVGNDFRAVDHYVKAIEILTRRGMDIKVLTLGKEIPGLQSERVKYGRFDRVYDDFFNNILVYLVINYAYSPNHLTAAVQRSHPKDWRTRAIYEVQNIESQMSGAALLGHESNVIHELFDPGRSGFTFPRFDDPIDIADRLEVIVTNYPAIQSQARNWAMANFRWPDCIRRWEQALLDCLNR